MKKVALYARYSTDKQSETSIEDQFRLCEFAADRNGWEVVARYSDEAITGSFPMNKRNGSAQLLLAADRGEFEGIVIESLDRLSRDSIESQTFLSNMKYAEVRVVAISDGYDSELASSVLLGAVRSAMGEMYVQDLACKTHRGMMGQVERGYAAGAAPYGYCNEKVEGGSEIHIVPEEAAIVNRIFSEYVSGISPHNIAASLNRDGIPSPRNSSWHVSAIAGSQKKSSGILHNVLYTGVHVWNRTKWVKNPTTKKRTRKDRPESEWKVEHRPDLRVVSDELWEKSRERFEKSRIKGGTRGRGGKIKTLLGGLIICGKCGGTVISINAHSYGCSNRRDRGKDVCEGLNIAKKKAETQLLPSLQSILSDPDVVDYVYSEASDVLKKLVSEENKDQNSVNRRLAELDGSIERLVDAISQLGSSESLIERLKKAESEKLALLKQSEVNTELLVLPTKKEIQKIFDAKVYGLNEVLTNNVELARASLSEVLGDIVLKKSGLELLPR